MYLALKPNSNAAVPQDDLDKLAKWRSWKMELHPQKYHVIPISRNRNINDNTYMIHGKIVEAVSMLQLEMIQRHAAW